MTVHHKQEEDSFSGYHPTLQLQHISSSFSIRSNNNMNELNLSVVDEAYGNHSDLYLQVLQVKPNAGSAQIQEAYFDRRNELFHILSQMNRTDLEDTDHQKQRQQHQLQYNTERKMDAVVCAVRILGDPDLRLQYDDMRTERIRLYRQDSHGTTTPNTTTTGTTSSTTITHKNRNNNRGLTSPTSALSPPSPNAKSMNRNSNNESINSVAPLPLFPVEAVPDMISSTATVSTADINNDATNTSTNFFEFFSVHDVSINMTDYFETTMNSYYNPSPAAGTTNIAKNVDSKSPPSILFHNVDDENVNQNDRNKKSIPVPLTSSKRQIHQKKSIFESSVPQSPPIQKRLPLIASPTTSQQLRKPQTLQQKVASTGTMTVNTATTDGDGSFSKESTVYYDDDDDDDNEEEEEDTYYTMDEDDEDEDDDFDDDESRQPQHSKSKVPRKNRASDPSSVSCLDHGMDRIRVEMLDAIDDTMTAFEQVLNVFTLQEDDIVAVMSRIDKAKRQVATTHIIYPYDKKDSRNFDYIHGDDYDTDIIPTKSSNGSQNKKSKLLPPPPSSSVVRDRKVKSSNRRIPRQSDHNSATANVPVSHRHKPISSSKGRQQLY